MAIDNKEELNSYAVRMRVRGDSYREIKVFLDKNWSNQLDIKAAIAHTKELEKNKLLVKDPKGKPISRTNVVMGGLVALFGFVMVILLWNRGWVSFLPFAVIGIGLTGMAKR